MTRRNKTISILAVATTVTVVSSCSSGYSYRRPESVNDKIDRYQSRNKNANEVPEVKVEDYAFDTGKRNRGPASVNFESKKDKGLNQYNNKRLYFLTLFSQYQEIGKYSSKGVVKKLNHCPSFHTSYLNFKESNTITNNGIGYKLPFNNLNTISNEKKVSKYPEFYLPMSNTSTRPRVIDIVSKSDITKAEVVKNVQRAIDIHVTKTFSELNELCDTGTSANYYTYENLITHIKTKSKLNPNKVGLQTLVKTTLFSNMAIQKSMKKYQKKKSRSIASFAKKQSYGSEVMKRLEVPWAENYFK
jgi:hypothetical protein